MDVSTRRNFMKAAVSASVFAASAPHQLLGKILPEFKGNDETILGVFTVKLSDYPILSQVFGSVKIRFEGTGNTFKNAIVTRTSTNTFVACSDVCTHSGCSVDVYNTSSMQLNCPCHQSAFKADGTVVQGPADSDLTKFPIAFTGGDSLQIEVAGLVSGIENGIDRANYLREISPNPLTHNSVVEFGLSSADDVVLAIHNSLGVEIIKLANGHFERGDYSIPLKSEELTSGIYFCTINTARGFKVSHKFVVMK